MSTSDISPPRQKGDISKGEMENQAGGQPTAVPDPSHTELTKDEFVTKTSRNQPTEAESLCDAQRSKEEATIPEFTACEEKRLPSREVEGPSKDEDGTKRRGDRVTNAGVLIAECEDDLDYDELMESEAYDRSTQHQVHGDRMVREAKSPSSIKSTPSTSKWYIDTNSIKSPPSSSW